ncbi:CapA family protein [Porphyromonas gulae]|uniref:Capsule biosynthesis protein CapA n=1 Tax=Porphyromonas gulae TaxID=111105 RepID=A0A0A2FHE4_9PORP|nr:CapA family protein [Porphyromonas gulae]KGN90496.1 capsule biosynthesis protein CapA [Porphyromonas gulae]
MKHFVLRVCMFFSLLLGGWISSSCRGGATPSSTGRDSVPTLTDTLEIKLLFAGDIMTHGPQIEGAKREGGRVYDFSSSFDTLASRMRAADLAIGNLETTFAGAPYSGYPTFSSPDAMGEALRDAGFDVLTTANNHTADKGKKGIMRTLDMLDSLGIAHTGSYRDIFDRDKMTPLILEVKGVCIAILAYTYGTNGMPVPPPTWVDPIDTVMIKKDLLRADSLGADYRIVQIHWGAEYRKDPDSDQLGLARKLHRYGADAIIGSHPHVVQRSEWLKSDFKTSFVIYSMGNFISNQRKPAATRGGMLLSLTLRKVGDRITAYPDYQYVFVNKRTAQGERVYRLLPVDPFSTDTLPTLPPEEQQDYKEFVKYYRTIPLVRQEH